MSRIVPAKERSLGAVASALGVVISGGIVILLPATTKTMLPQNLTPTAAAVSTQDQISAHGATARAQNQQIVDETAQLYKMAGELKTEVDKTNKDVLSISVMRKAEAIERLARDVKGKMKAVVGPN